MTEFVKICPRCSAANPEYENICSSCQQFIGMEPAIPKPVTAVPEAENNFDGLHSTVQKNIEAKIPFENTVDNETEIEETEEKPAIYAQISNSNEILMLYPESIIGQTHPSSQATAPIPSHIPGAAYVHRQHCRIEYDNEQWYVFAIDQSAYQQEFNNPTRVNQKVISPGSRQRIYNNDELRLSGVSLRLRIM